MKKLRKSIAVFSFALIAALCFGMTASAELWGEEVILEYAEYCKTHSYQQQIAMYFEMFQADDGGGSTSFFTEEEFLRIKNGENALIVIDYELSDEVFDWVGEPKYNLHFPILMSDGREINSGYRPEAACLHRLTDRNVFTVREHLLEGGVENETDKIIFMGLDTADGYISGYDFKGYTFIPCENGWNEIDGARYYVKKDGTLATSSLIIGGIRYQFGKDGVCGGEYTGFTKSDKGKRCWKDGKLIKNERFEAKNGRRYYADENGYLTEILTLTPFSTGDGCEVLGEQRIEFGEAVSQSRAVVRAKCVGLTWQFNSDRDYLFLLNETLSGEDISDSFTLRVRVDDIDVDDPSSQRTYYRYTGEDILFREDTEYLLLLTEIPWTDDFSPTADAVIPLGEDGAFENAAIQGRPLDELDRIEQVKDYLPVIPKTIAFQKPDPDKLDESDDIKVEFDEAVSMSFTLVRAKCMGLIEQTSEKRVYCFTRKELLGRTGGELPYIFYVTVAEGWDHAVEDAPGYTSADIHYKENTDYLLPLRKSSSVFYEHDEYYSIGDTVIELKKNGAFKNPTIQGRRIEAPTKLSRLWRYLVDRELFCGQTTDEIGTKFTRSDNLGEVVSCSDYILDVTVSDYFYDADDRTTYTCTVNETLKAKNTKITTVYAALPKDGAKIGGQYLLLLNRVSDDSYVYVVSSLTHSVHPADSPAADEVRAIVKG